MILNSKLSRRDLLKAGAVFSLSGLLAACDVSNNRTTPSENLASPSLTPPAIEQPSATPAAKPTAAAEATSIPTPTAPITIGKERFTHGYAEVTPPDQILIDQGKKSGVILNPEDVSQLTFDVRDNQRRQGEKIVFARDPKSHEIILATRTDLKTRELIWHVAGLRDMADAIGILMGSNVYSQDRYINGTNALNSKINEIVMQDFNKAIVIDACWGALEKVEGKIDFSSMDSIVDQALANDMVVEGDDLIYGLDAFRYSYLSSIEETFKAQGLNPQQMKDRLWGIVQNHVKTLVEHYKGKVSIWSAINEYRGQIEANPSNPDHFSQLSQGDDNGFIEMVCQTARTADPGAMLFWNDSDMFLTNSYNYKYARPRVEFLRQKGLIDAVAEQFVNLDSANPPAMDAVSQAMIGWGMPAFISSAMFGIKNVPGSDDAKADRQAQVASEMLDIALDSGVCKDFSMWQAAEGYTNRSFRGADDKASIFDANMKPNLAYFAIKDRLTARIDSGWSAA